MDQYKDVLFPRAQSKFAKKASEDHERALKQARAEDDRETLEHRKRILQLAEMMQYDDDIEESKVFAQKEFT